MQCSRSPSRLPPTNHHHTPPTTRRPEPPAAAATSESRRHTWATLPVPRKGPQAGEVRARSAAPFEAAHLAQSCLPRNPGPASWKGPTGPTLRANPCPEVTDQDCRFPLPTLIYRLEAPNLGDLMRRWVQSVSKLDLRPVSARGDRLSPTASATPYRVSGPCDFLTCIFHGLALVHGTTQELCRSTATVWFAKPSSPARFV